MPRCIHKKHFWNGLADFPTHTIYLFFIQATLLPNTFPKISPTCRQDMENQQVQTQTQVHGQENETGIGSATQARGFAPPAFQLQAGPAAPLQRNVVQRKIGSDENVVFGLSGRNLEDIRAAIAEGYTTFDGADSYGDTITHLSTAIQEAIGAGKARTDFDVIYKVDQTPAAELDAHLRTVAGRFNGFLDHVLIHKVTDEATTAAYNPILAALKADNIIRNVGSGDVKAGMDAEFAGRDSFEINASELFLGPDARTLIEKLNTAGKPVFVYNVVNALKNLLGMEDDPSAAQVKGMVSKIKLLVPKAEPILSSGNAERLTANFGVNEIMDDEWVGVGDTHTAIDAAVRAQNGVPTITDAPEDVKTKISEIMLGTHGIFEWDATDMYATEAEYTDAKARITALFTAEQLAVRYQGVGPDEAKIFTLEHIIDMLFDSTGNCHRVEASNFLLRGLGYL